MSRNVWGYWDCIYCGKKKIRADNEVCPGCSATRNEDTKFYMDLDNKEYVTEDKVNNAPNWICSFCDSQNEDYEQVCEYCGASKVDSEANYFEQQRKQERDERGNACETLSESKENAPLTPDTKKGNVSRWKRLKPNLKGILLPLTIFCIFIGILVTICMPVTKEMTITSFEWERSIGIEELQTLDETGWSLPTGARLDYTKTELHHYDSVLDHYETKTRTVTKQRIVGYETYITGYTDLGNGQFRENTAQRPVYETYTDTETYQDPVYKQVPVYQTKYYYEIDRWVEVRSVDTKGYDKEAYWGAVSLKSEEREGDRDEEYYIKGTVDGEQECKRYSVDYRIWGTLEVGDEVEFKTTRFGDDVLELQQIDIAE